MIDVLDLDPMDKAVLKVLLERGYYMSSRDVAIQTGISWNTAKAHLESLRKKGLINRERRGRKIMWTADVWI